MNLENLVKACIEYKNAGGNLDFSSPYNSLARDILNEYREKIFSLVKGKLFYIQGIVSKSVFIEMSDSKESVKELYKLEELVSKLDKFPIGKLGEDIEIETVTPIPGGIICDVFVIRIPFIKFKSFVTAHNLEVQRSKGDQLSLIREQINFIESLSCWRE